MSELDVIAIHIRADQAAEYERLFAEPELPRLRAVLTRPRGRAPAVALQSVHSNRMGSHRGRNIRTCSAPGVQERAVRSVLRLPSLAWWRSRLPC
jgi:hypothetical protein